MKIYLSYSLAQTDLHIASLLTRQAQEKGVVVETAQQIAPGSNWASMIAHPILGSDMVIAIVSRDSRNVTNVQRELEFARQYGKGVLALVEKGINLQIHASGIQYVEFDRQDLSPALSRISLILEGHNNQEVVTKWLVAGGLALLALYLIDQEK